MVTDLKYRYNSIVITNWSLIYFEPWFLKGSEHYLFKLVNGDLAIAVLVHHPHVALHVFRGALIIWINLSIGFL